MAQKVWQDPGEAVAKLLPAVPLPRDPLHQSISNPPGIPVPGLVPGPHLADYVIPQHFLPQLFPEKSQGGEDRVNRAAHLVQSGAGVGQLPCQPEGPLHRSTWTTVSQDTHRRPHSGTEYSAGRPGFQP